MEHEFSGQVKVAGSQILWRIGQFLSAISASFSTNVMKTLQNSVTLASSLFYANIFCILSNFLQLSSYIAVETEQQPIGCDTDDIQRSLIWLSQYNTAPRVTATWQSIHCNSHWVVSIALSSQQLSCSNSIPVATTWLLQIT